VHPPTLTSRREYARKTTVYICCRLSKSYSTLPPLSYYSTPNTPTSLLDFLLSEFSFIRSCPTLADRKAGEPNEMKQKNVRASSNIIPYLLRTHTKRVVWKG
jgi:hypothetical protein